MPQSGNHGIAEASSQERPFLVNGKSKSNLGRRHEPRALLGALSLFPPSQNDDTPQTFARIFRKQATSSRPLCERIARGTRR